MQEFVRGGINSYSLICKLPTNHTVEFDVSTLKKKCHYCLIMVSIVTSDSLNRVMGIIICIVEP
jgi:hypothetical protein